VLTSSPRANGFYKAGRVKKYIPGIYRVNELQLLKKYPQLKMHEWEAFGWTYHAKGAWFYNPEEKDKVDLSVIGSSNYSYRSNRRDTEC
jgi:CDP-diacylglycerol--glycerol-3-phosphate 3-phosphatidyltransferase